MFCSKCGTMLPNDALYCTTCGAPTTLASSGNHSAHDLTLEDADVAGVAPVAASAKRASTRVPTRRAPSQRYEPSNANYNDGYYADYADEPYPKKRRSPVLVGLLALLAALAILCALYFFVFAPMFNLPRPSVSNAPSESVPAATSTVITSAVSSDETTSAASAASAAEAASSEAVATATDAEIRAEILPYYNRLSGFNSEVSTCANRFNNTLTNTDYGTRKSAADACRNLSSRLHSEYDELAALSVPSTSAHYQAYSDMLICYDDLCHRVDVLIECWDLSLEYSDPTGHGDTITEPLYRDAVGGTNKYYADYNERVDRIDL